MSEALEILKSCDAFLEGHFLLSSGRHSSAYCQMAYLQQYPDRCAEVMKAVADKWVGLGNDLAVVAGVGQGLLKAHHTGGKDHLAHGDALGTHRLAGKDHAICQKKICVHSFPRFNAECCHIFSVLALSVSADALPPPPKWEALAVHATFMVLPKALPLWKDFPRSGGRCHRR